MAIIASSSAHYVRRTSVLPAYDRLSMSTWVKLVTIDATQTGHKWALGIGPDPSPNEGLFISIFNSANPENVAFQYGASGDYLYQATPPDSILNDWVYLAISQAGSGANQLKAYIWDQAGTLLGSLSRTGVNFTPATIGLNVIPGYTYAFTSAKWAYTRIWAGTNAGDVLTEAEFNTERQYATIQKTTWINTALGTDNAETDVSGSGRPWINNGMTIATDDEPPVTAAGGSLVLPTYDRMFRQNTLLRM